MDRLIYTAFQSINNALDNKAIRSQNLSSTNTPGFKADMSLQVFRLLLLSRDLGYQGGNPEVLCPKLSWLMFVSEFET